MPDPLSHGATAHNLRHRAEHLAAGLPALLIEAERIANTMIHGSHGYRRAGPGEAFWQFRRYQSGDPAASIDWRRSAKGQKVFVREREREAAQSVWLWADSSPSMHFGAVDKAYRAAVLSLTLAVLLHRTGEHVAVLGAASERVSGRMALAGIADALVPKAPEKGDAAAPSLPAFTRVPRHARLVLFSDFLAPLDELEAMIEGYRLRGVEGCLVQVLDASEEDFDYRGRTRFEGLEGEGALTIGRVESIAEDYRDHFKAWREALAALGQRASWPLISHRTDHPPQLTLLAILGALGRGPC